MRHSAPATRSSPARSSDWATDFSHVEPQWSADPYPIQDDLRQRCPIAHTERFGGAWLPTRFEDVAAIAYDTERFSSRSIILSNFRPPRELAPIGGSPPISSDPPFHHDARKLLLAAFTKTAVARQEPATRAFCHSLIDSFTDGTSSTPPSEYAQHIPMRVIADMLGFPPQDGPQFREFVEDTARRHQPAAGGPHRADVGGCPTTCSRRSTTTSTTRARTSRPT